MASGNEQLLSHLGSGGTVLTANRRQSGILHRLHDEAQVRAGRRCWPTAEVLPVEAWLAARWHELAADNPSLPTLLGDMEAAWPWREAAGRFLDPSLVAIADLSAAARRAWLQLRRYGASLDDLDQEYLTRDQRQFLEWARSVEATLAAEGWLDPGLLELAVAGEAARLEPLPELLLAGFDRPTPALDTLASRLSGAGRCIRWAGPSKGAGTARWHAAADPVDEVRAWTAWTRERLSGQPEARLAVIVPDLASRRAAIERALDAALQPALELPGSREQDRPYDLAGGEALSAYGVAASALDCLACLEPRLDWEVLSRVLMSRHTPAGDDDDARSRLDLELRRRGVAAWPLPVAAKVAKRLSCTGVAEALEATQRLLAEGPARRGTDDWAHVFGATLNAWGWPGTDALDSDEYQAAEALRDRLAAFARASRVAPRLDLAQARSEFARTIQGPFQPERGVPSVWILDALEPPGLEFDGLWVSGLTAAAWPLPARHEAFLPVALQRRLGMPGVTAEDALELAQSTIGAWCHGARELVFSCPRRQDDAEVEPSRLIPAGLAVLEPPAAMMTRARQLQQACRLEPLAGEPAVPLQGAAAGGARILELQAKCPFRAFAELRLAARPLDEPVAGIDPRVRGTLLHATLERLWQELGDRAALEALGAAGTADLVERCLQAAMRDHLPVETGPRAAQLEREWQHSAALRALALDLQRDDFRVIATEEPLHAELEGLGLRLRVDRVDRVDDGLVVLDYKTGRASPSQWRGTRPDAPQLPLYAILKGDDVGGVAFVSLAAQAATLQGVAREAQLCKGMQLDERFALTDAREKGYAWDEIRRHWRAWLAALARDYSAGRAEVDPKLPATCRACHLATLCRVAPGLDPDETLEGEDD